VGFSACGLIVALWADKFEQVNCIPTFVITPLTFLGGVFYSATMLSPPFRKLLAWNPIYYMIESMRFALVGRTQINPAFGFAVLVALAFALLAAALELLRRGYKLRT
jgi:ABC-2 type transport system permease protein